MSGLKCLVCGGAADLGVTDGLEVLAYCIPCAKKLAEAHGMPSLQTAAEDAERGKSAKGGERER